MKDRYLIKAKRIDTREWVTGYYCPWVKGETVVDSSIAWMTNGGILRDEVDPSTICQCTGVKDEKDTLIYENDIVYMRMNEHSGYGKVVYKYGCYCVYDKKRGRMYPFSNHGIVFRVDGNIFDNPELLE